jgi:hypothetical protein
LEDVHKNYIQIWTDLYQEAPFNWERGLPGYEEKLRKVTESLQKRRTELEPARRRLRVMTKEINAINITDQTKDFTDSAIRYLCQVSSLGETDEVLPKIGFQSLSEEILDKLLLALNTNQFNHASFDHSNAADLEIIDVRELIELTLQQQRNAWNSVCESFSRLKINVVMKD